MTFTLIRGGRYGARHGNRRVFYSQGVDARGGVQGSEAAPPAVEKGLARVHVRPENGAGNAHVGGWEHIGVTVVRVLGRILAGGAVSW